MRQLVSTSLLLIITLRFTCAESEICSTTKKSQNNINMTVDIKYCFTCGESILKTVNVS